MQLLYLNFARFPVSTLFLGGGFEYFSFFTPIWGRFPIWILFFRWVVQRPTRFVIIPINNYSQPVKVHLGFSHESRFIPRLVVSQQIEVTGFMMQFIATFPRNGHPKKVVIVRESYPTCRKHSVQGFIYNKLPRLVREQVIRFRFNNTAYYSTKKPCWIFWDQCFKTTSMNYLEKISLNSLLKCPNKYPRRSMHELFTYISWTMATFKGICR